MALVDVQFPPFFPIREPPMREAVLQDEPHVSLYNTLVGGKHAGVRSAGT